MTVLLGSTVTLRPATPADVLALVTIRATPEVQERWGGADDLTAEILDDLVAPELHLMVIDEADRIVGAIQWQASEDPVYRHAGIDLYVDPALHGRGLGTDAVRTLARHLSTTIATTGWSSTRPPTTWQPSVATRRSGSDRSASCDSTSAGPTAPGTTGC